MMIALLTADSRPAQDHSKLVCVEYTMVDQGEDANQDATVLSFREIAAEYQARGVAAMVVEIERLDKIILVQRLDQIRAGECVGSAKYDHISAQMVATINYSGREYLTLPPVRKA